MIKETDKEKLLQELKTEYNHLTELFDIAWTLNKNDNTRTTFSQKVTTYIPDIQQTLSYFIGELQEDVNVNKKLKTEYNYENVVRVKNKEELIILCNFLAEKGYKWQDGHLSNKIPLGIIRLMVFPFGIKINEKLKSICWISPSVYASKEDWAVFNSLMDVNTYIINNKM